MGELQLCVLICAFEGEEIIIDFYLWHIEKVFAVGFRQSASKAWPQLQQKVNMRLEDQHQLDY